MNNEGQITGTYLMLNLYMIYKENIMITNNQDIIERESKNLGACFDIIIENMGKEVILLRLISQQIALIYL